MTCPDCLSATTPGAAFCGFCGTPLTGAAAGEEHQPGGPYSLGASASQFPRTPADQYVPGTLSGQHSPPAAAPPREFRLNLRRLGPAIRSWRGRR